VVVVVVGVVNIIMLAPVLSNAMVVVVSLSIAVADPSTVVL
jgi:hypothetical protein